MRSLSDELVIQPKLKRGTGLKELWLYRELFLFFAWRDIKVRYKQTAIGAGWAILQPILATAIFTIFFNRVAGISTGSANIPYPVFAFLGLLYWNTFAAALNTMSISLVSNQGVLSKVYFPRLIPPLAAVAISIVDFFFAAIVFAILLLIFGIVPSLLAVALFIPSLLLIVLGALGPGIFFAALNVKYRDVKSALPFIIQILFFITPIIYPVTLIPENLRIYTYLNPAAGAITTIRAGLFGTDISVLGVFISVLSATIMLILGVWYFKRTERNFADII